MHSQCLAYRWMMCSRLQTRPDFISRSYYPLLFSDFRCVAQSALLLDVV